jgi:hypothetical protein
MLKNLLLVGLGVVLTMAILGVAGFALAQSQTPPAPNSGYGPGMMGGRGGMMGGRGGQGYGPMHEYMEKAMAEALGVTEEELEEQLAQGKTMWQVAEEKGLTWEEFTKVMTEARTAALKQMVEDGVITQAQADWMASHMQGMWGRGGRGGCPDMGGGSGPGWRQAPQAPSSSG